MQWLTRKEGRKKLLNRIRRIKGQIEALESVQKESSDDCSAVLQQIASIRGGGCGRADDDRAGGAYSRAYRRRKGIARPEAGGYRTGHIGVALL